MVRLRVLGDGASEIAVKLPKRWRRERTVRDGVELVRGQLFPAHASSEGLELVLETGDVVVSPTSTIDALLSKLPEEEEARVVRVRPAAVARAPAPDLPPDVLGVSFDYAWASGARLARVDRRWREAIRAMTPSLRVSRDAEPRHVEQLLECVGAVRAVSFKCCLHLDAAILARSAEVWGGTALTAVDVSYCGGPGDDDIAAMIERLPKLERLQAAGTNFGRRAFGALRGVPRLVALDASFCEAVDDAGVVGWLDGGRAADLPLRSIALSWYDGDAGGDAVGDASVRAIARRCGRLDDVALDHRPTLTAAALRRASPGLQSLSLTACKAAPAAVLRNLLAANAATLRVLVLAACSDHVDDRVLRGLVSGGGAPSLERLSVWSCGLVTDRGVAAAAKAAPLLAACNLSLCWRLTADAVDALAHHCPRLATLHVSGCGSMNKAEAQRIIRARLGDRCTVEGLAPSRVACAKPPR